MKRKNNLYKKFLFFIFFIFSLFFLTNCTPKRIVIDDNRIMAYWIDKGEIAPFHGVLLNDYTFYKLEEIAEECGKIENKN